MKQYDVTGMSCAACSSRVESAVCNVAGVDSVSVSLLTNSMAVEGNASDSDIIAAVENAGYGASIKGQKNNTETELKDTETPKLKKRLAASLVFWIILMYFSMGHMMWGFPLPAFMNGNHVAMGLLQLLLTAIVMVINQKFFISGFKGLINRAPNMDTLVALGASAAFGYSIVSLFAMTDAVLKGNEALVMYYMDELYFESAATILTLITVGKMLEARSKGKTTDALKSLMRLSPKTATVIRGEAEVNVPIEEVAIGDIFVVRPGESVPVDGIVIEGESAVDESALTGESIPVDKSIDDKVSAATINKSGFLKCQATRVGEDTTLSQIIQMVSDAAATKAPIAKIADKVSGIFVPTVITLSIITFVVWTLAGYDIGFTLARAISVLVISCPCALGLATPVAIMVGNGKGAKNGILYKTAAAIEGIAGIDTVILDKTGTITNGKPEVIEINSSNQDKLLMIAGSLESKSEHPLAIAVTDYVKEHGIATMDVTEFSALPGNGLKGKIQGTMYYGGNRKLIENVVNITPKCFDSIDELSKKGYTPLLFASDSEFLGIIAVADDVKSDSKDAILELKNMGIHVVMLTGDNEQTAKAIAGRVGVDDVIAGVLPDGKEAIVRKFQNNGKVAMVGDGINDAPALVRADIGIAIGAGTDVAIDAADVVLVKSRLLDVPAAIRLGRATLLNIKENLFWAFIYNVIGIPLAAGVWYPIFGIKLNPMFGAAAMSLSSFCVVTNALRLNLLDVHNAKHDRKKHKNRESFATDENACCINDKDMEDNKMTKTMNITGMMCPHCEARVKSVLEALDGVSEAVVSHESGTAIVTLSGDVSDEVLKTTVENEKYEVTGIS